MNTKNQLFLKGLQGYTRRDNAIANHEAMDTLYYWWWLFMRLSPVFWYEVTFAARFATSVHTVPEVRRRWMR